MKKVLFFFLLCCIGHFAQAQRVYFVYLQSEAGAPFYVKMGDKVFSSSSEGYLILSNLKDSTYSFVLGQTGKTKEVQFSITVNKNDKGYVIKTVDNNLVLFDLQTLSLTKPVVLNQPSSGTIARTDYFTKLLAKAADDTTLLYQVAFAQPEQKQKEKEVTTAINKQPEQKKEEVVALPPTETQVTIAPAVVSKVDTLVQSKEKADDSIAIRTSEKKEPSDPSPAKPEESSNTIIQQVSVQEPSINEEEYKKSVVEKRSESSTSEGFGLVFWDKYEGAVDTIRIVIPNPKMVFRDTTSAQAVADKKDYLNITSEASDSTAVSNKDVVANNAAAPRKAICNNVSTDDDFFKLRRDMAGEKSDEGMMAQAGKYFRSKCFKTEQIKYLSTLFLTEASKYQFFDLAYMHVSDQERFDLLQAELKDSYYINRFKALIAK